jgi:hypothetical protein
VFSDGKVYDGLRHFLFVIPCLVVFSGAALETFIAGVVRYNRVLGLSLTIPLLALLLHQGYAMVRLHPYQYVYYNALVGGIRGADGLYEKDYWAQSYKEAVSILVHFLRERDGDRFEAHIYRVHVEGPKWPAQYYFPKNFRYVDDEEKADFVISYTRGEKHLKTFGMTVGAVKRFGVDLAIIKEVAPFYPEDD